MNHLPEDFRCCSMAWRGARLRCGKCGKARRVTATPTKIRQSAPLLPPPPPKPKLLRGRKRIERSAAASVFGRQLRAWILRRKITRKALAAATGIVRSNIHRYERGFVVPGDAQVDRLAASLGITRDDLLPESAIMDEMLMMADVAEKTISGSMNNAVWER